MPDGDIAKLAARKSKEVEPNERASNWFAVWAGVDPEGAIPALARHLEATGNAERQTAFAMRFITYLAGETHGVGSNERKAFLAPKHLKQLYLLMHQYIRVRDDIERAGKGGYSPDLRDYAQRARNQIGEMLRHTPGKHA